MPTHEHFLKTICAYPSDDGPKLVYADWLEEFGGDPERAEYIRLSCLRNKLSLDQCDRALALAAKNRQRWVPESFKNDPKIDVRWADGFIQCVVLPWELWYGDGFMSQAKFRGAAPITHVSLTTEPPITVDGLRCDRVYDPQNKLSIAHFSADCWLHGAFNGWQSSMIPSRWNHELKISDRERSTLRSYLRASDKWERQIESVRVNARRMAMEWFLGTRWPGITFSIQTPNNPELLGNRQTFIAAEDIMPCRFVTRRPGSMANNVRQCRRGDAPIGVSHRGTRTPPVSALSEYAAVYGELIAVHFRPPCYVELATDVEAGQVVESNDEGLAEVVMTPIHGVSSMDGGRYWVAEENGRAGDQIRVTRPQLTPSDESVRQ